ncbi:MAG: BMP family ABC transporter substrate-binding protein [Lachnospiraceae bacterium]|nr:BMP family ABC transporter substrate-binding protein [Lachnospiraceae bacterium]
MKRMRIVTVITALVMICIFAFINYLATKDDDQSRTIKVGFVYDGDASAPYSYNFIRAQKKLDAYDFGGRVTTVAKENVSDETCEQALRELIEEGCDLIFTTSYGYGEVAKRFAKEYPEVQFCEATCDNANQDPLPNYHTFMGEIYQGRYITGIVAGMKLKEMIDQGVITAEEAKLGYVGAYPYAEVISGYTAFLLGVRSIVPTATMEVQYTNTWTSYVLEKKCAQSLIDDGCVILAQHSDTIGPAVVCEEAAEQGKSVYHVGYNQSMIDIAPTTSLVSTRIDWSHYIIAATEAVLNEKPIEKSIEGNVNGNDVGAGFEQGWVQILDLNGLIIADGTQAAVDQAIEKFKKEKRMVFVGDYVGVDPLNPEDVIDLRSGYEENKSASAPSFHYVLKDVITIKD